MHEYWHSDLEGENDADKLDGGSMIDAIGEKILNALSANRVLESDHHHPQLSSIREMAVIRLTRSVYQDQVDLYRRVLMRSLVLSSNT